MATRYGTSKGDPWHGIMSYRRQPLHHAWRCIEPLCPLCSLQTILLMPYCRLSLDMYIVCHAVCTSCFKQFASMMSQSSL